MTTKRQVRQLFIPILKRNPDVVQRDRITLWLTPIRHLACRVTIDRCSDPDVPNPSWHIMDLIEPQTELPYFGRFAQPLHGQGQGRWRWSDADMEDRLRGLIEADVLPFFRAIGTLENYVALQRRHYRWGPNHMPINDLIMDIALGDLATARTSFDGLWERYQRIRADRYAAKAPIGTGFNKELSILALLKDDLLSEHRTGLARTLFAWEAENIARLQAEHLWEPTPFPLEQDGQRSWPVSDTVTARLEAMTELTPRTIWNDVSKLRTPQSRHS